jgi:osmotically-inducible protein OsmY
MGRMHTTTSSHQSAVKLPSDTSICEQTISLLNDSGHRSLGRLDCRVHQGVIELSGKVPSFYLKQLAQAVALRVETARGVQNRVRVG